MLPADPPVDPVDAALADLQANPGSQAAWDTLYRLLWPFLVASAYRIVGADNAEDVAQDAFLALMRTPLLERFANGARLRAYLGTAVRHRSYDLIRRERRLVPADELEELATASIEAELEEVYQADELLSRIRDSLSPADRNLLDRVLLGFSAQEIAEQVEITYVAARVRVYRLRERIQGYLDSTG